MREHIQVKQPGLLKPRVKIPCHLIDDRSFAMNDLIMGEGQEIGFVKEILHRKQKLSDIPSAVSRLLTHVFQRIVHPAKVPFVVEAQTILRCRFCCPGKRSGVLRDQHCIRIKALQAFIHTLHKVHGVMIDPSSAVSLPVDQVADSIKSKSIEMILVKPECAGRLQEGAHIPAGVHEVAAAPFAVPDCGVRILI